MIECCRRNDTGRETGQLTDEPPAGKHQIVKGAVDVHFVVPGRVPALLVSNILFCFFLVLFVKKKDAVFVNFFVLIISATTGFSSSDCIPCWAVTRVAIPFGVVCSESVRQVVVIVTRVGTAGREELGSRTLDRHLGKDSGPLDTCRRTLERLSPAGE